MAAKGEKAMRARHGFFGLLALLLVPGVQAGQQPALTGQYVEFRNADVYTGPCFANAEMGLAGNRAILGWHIDRGSWQGVKLDGLSVVAVVRASNTLGDPSVQALPAESLLLVDARGDARQRAALASFARAQAGALLEHVVAVEPVPIEFRVTSSQGAARLVAGQVVRLETRPVGAGDHFCHNEEVYYPPLVGHLNCPMPAVVLASVYRGDRLGTQWNDAGRRSAFVASFAQ